MNNGAGFFFYRLQVGLVKDNGSGKSIKFCSFLVPDSLDDGTEYGVNNTP